MLWSALGGTPVVVLTNRVTHASPARGEEEKETEDAATEAKP